MTVLKKDGGGVRGGESQRTIAQQLGPAVEMCTSPFQCALSTRAGCECIVHVLQSLTELDPLAIVTSIDGKSAYDSISRKAMVEGLTEFREEQFSHSSTCSTPNHLLACGKTRMGQCTQSFKAKEESKGIPSCPFSSPWANTLRWRLFNVDALVTW